LKRKTGFTVFQRIDCRAFGRSDHRFIMKTELQKVSRVLTGIRSSDGVMTMDIFWHCMRKKHKAQSHHFKSIAYVRFWKRRRAHQVHYTGQTAC
jgi:hypothetical protein